MPFDESQGDWEVEQADFGGRVARHRHGELSATAYLYSNPDEVWAECTLCGQKLTLEQEQPASVRHSHRGF